MSCYEMQQLGSHFAMVNHHVTLISSSARRPHPRLSVLNNFVLAYSHFWNLCSAFKEESSTRVAGREGRSFMALKGNPTGKTSSIHVKLKTGQKYSQEDFFFFFSVSLLNYWSMIFSFTFQVSTIKPDLNITNMSLK